MKGKLITVNISITHDDCECCGLVDYANVDITMFGIQYHSHDNNHTGGEYEYDFSIDCNNPLFGTMDFILDKLLEKHAINVTFSNMDDNYLEMRDALIAKICEEYGYTLEVSENEEDLWDWERDNDIED